MTEKTLCIIKPDAVENDYVEKINEMIIIPPKKKIEKTIFLIIVKS